MTLSEPLDWMDKKPQVPLLRCGPVGMTSSFKVDNFARKINVTASQDDE